MTVDSRGCSLVLACKACGVGMRKITESVNGGVNGARGTDKGLGLFKDKFRGHALGVRGEHGRLCPNVKDAV